MPGEDDGHFELPSAIRRLSGLIKTLNKAISLGYVSKSHI